MAVGRLFVARHGNTFAPGQTPTRVGCRTDLPLVENGLFQASALGGYFAARGLRFARIVSGPLRRTRATAEAIAHAQGAAVEIEDWLTEVDHGPDEDREEEAVIARIGAEALSAWNSDGTLPEGWSIDVAAVTDGWRGLMAQATATAQDILAVTSNGTARFLFAAGVERPAGAALTLRTGAYVEIACENGRFPVLTAWNLRP